jgi:hypothetical protein
MPAGLLVLPPSLRSALRAWSHPITSFSSGYSGLSPNSHLFLQGTHYCWDQQTKRIVSRSRRSETGRDPGKHSSRFLDFGCACVFVKPSQLSLLHQVCKLSAYPASLRGCLFSHAFASQGGFGSSRFLRLLRLHQTADLSAGGIYRSNWESTLRQRRSMQISSFWGLPTKQRKTLTTPGPFISVIPCPCLQGVTKRSRYDSTMALLAPIYSTSS